MAQFGETIEYNYFKFYFELLARPHKNALVFIYSGINEGIGNTKDENFDGWKTIQRSIILSKVFAGIFNNSPQKYKFRYEQVLSLAAYHGYKTVISQLVGNVTGYDPVVSPQDDLLKPGHIDSLAKANDLFAKGKFADAEELYKALLRQMGNEHPYLIYGIARCMYAQQQYDSAKYYFGHLTEICSYTGYAHWKNEIIADVANRPNVALAHTYDRFVDSSENGLLGYELITDAHHPNLRGYCIMSRELAIEVSKLYGERIKRNISEDIVKRHFGFDNKFLNEADFIVVEWFIFEAFETQVRRDRLAKLNFYLRRYELFNPGDEVISVWKLLIAIMLKDERQMNALIHELSRSNNKKEMINRLKIGFYNKPCKAEIINTMAALNVTDKEDLRFIEEVTSALR